MFLSFTVDSHAHAERNAARNRLIQKQENMDKELLQDLQHWLESDSISRIDTELPHFDKRRQALLRRVRKALKTRKTPDLTNGCPNKKCETHGKPEIAEFSYQEQVWESHEFWSNDEGYHAEGTSETLYDTGVNQTIFCRVCSHEFPAPPDATINFV
jgi:hypothetical protein